MPTLRYNKEAGFKYAVYDRYEAGVELFGWEVVAIKKGNVDFKGSYIRAVGNELYWVNATISPIGEIKEEFDPTRTRKLLLHRGEINELLYTIKAKGMTVVPLRLFTTRNLIKLEIATAKGKKKFEQKLAQKKKSQDRQLKKDLKKSGIL